MPRMPRIEYAGALYHIMNRGDRREPIFLDDTDRQIFLRTLGETCAKTGWQIHAHITEVEGGIEVQRWKRSPVARQ